MRTAGLGDTPGKRDLVKINRKGRNAENRQKRGSGWNDEALFVEDYREQQRSCQRQANRRQGQGRKKSGQILEHDHIDSP